MACKGSYFYSGAGDRVPPSRPKVPGKWGYASLSWCLTPQHYFPERTGLLPEPKAGSRALCLQAQDELGDFSSQNPINHAVPGKDRVRGQALAGCRHGRWHDSVSGASLSLTTFFVQQHGFVLARRCKPNRAMWLQTPPGARVKKNPQSCFPLLSSSCEHSSPASAPQAHLRSLCVSQNQDCKRLMPASPEGRLTQEDC